MHFLLRLEWRILSEDNTKPNFGKIYQFIEELYPSIFKPFVWRIKETLNSKQSNWFEKVKKETGDLCKFSWEKIHFSGRWTSVQPLWRDCYALGKLVLVILLLFELFILKRGINCESRKQLLDCIRDLDLALMIGANTFRSIIQELVNNVHDIMIFIYGVPPLNDTSDLLPREHTPPPLKKQKQSDNIEPFCSGTPIPRIDASKIAVHDFLVQFVVTKKPVIIKNHIKHWPAFTKWRDSCAYLNQIAGYRTIPVEIGSNYVNEEWTQTLLTMNEYISKYLLQNQASQEKGYLAQHPLFDQIEILKRDIMEPDYLAAFEGNLKHVNAWIGPKGTVSPLHTDPYHNLFVQVVGSKYIRLYSQDKHPFLYVHKQGLLTNSSQIQHFFDTSQCNSETYPLFFKLNQSRQNYFDAILQRGEVLYIPPLMWHYVQSCSLSMSISYWT